MHGARKQFLAFALALVALGPTGVRAQQPPSDAPQTPSAQSATSPPTAVQVTPPAAGPAPLPAAPAPPPAAAPPTPQPDRRAGLELDVAALLGSVVRTPDGNDIGKVSRLMLDPRDGRVTTMVIGMGGTLGIGEKHLAVPFNSVKIGQDRQRIVVTVDQQLLEQAPRAEERRRGEPAASPPTAQPAPGSQQPGQPGQK